MELGGIREKYTESYTEKQGHEWNPIWLTLPQMADIHPVSLWHREQEEFSIPKEAAAYRNMHVLARSSFILRQEGRVQVQISADDRYKLYLDGEFIQEGPAPSHPEHYYYNTIQLPFVKAGRHVLGVHLYYQGCINRVFYSGDLRLAMAAELTDAKGAIIPLDFYCKRTEAYSGELIGYDTQYLENFDARLFPVGWNRADQNTAGWEQMKPAKWADYQLFPQPTKMLYHGTFMPRRVWKEPDGRIIVDIGREITGNLYLRAEGKAGNKVIIRCGEELLDHYKAGCHVRYDMRCGCRYEEEWILDDGENVWDPYDYKGFRYGELIADSGVVLDEIRYTIRHYPMEDTLCTLESDQSVLNRIFEICKHAVRLGTQERYLDCPTREKGQYLGDAVITAHAQVLLTGETDMLLKCIDQFAETARVCPGLLAVAPGGLMQEIADFSLLYPELLLLYYRITGDLNVIGRYFDTVQGIVEYFRQFARADGLLEQAGEKWNLVDWPENLRDGYDFDLSRPVVAAGCHNVINALYLGAVGSLVQMAELLGRSVPYKDQLAAWKQAYNTAFYRRKSGLLADSEVSDHAALHSNVYALYFNLVPQERKEHILDFVEEKGFSCGVMHSYFVLRVLAQSKRFDAMYRLLVNESEHGWIQMLREGATACFEVWGKDQKWNTSLCHPWASAPVPILLEEVAGIYPDPRCKKGYYFEPHIPDTIQYFYAVIPFRGKQLIVEKKDGKITLVTR